MDVVSIAKSYIGKTEKPNNSGFNDAEFEAKMKSVGFKPSESWCSYFAELCFKEAFPEKFKDLDKLFSASATKTFANFKAAGYKISPTPIQGALVLWQHMENGVAGWQGHAGICSLVIGKSNFESIEGNTNDQGGREGYTVARKNRNINPVKNGLQVMGFIII